jgi:hypothetical protein
MSRTDLDRLFSTMDKKITELREVIEYFLHKATVTDEEISIITSLEIGVDDLEALVLETRMERNYI